MGLQAWTRARSLARHQSGVVSRRQLLALGIPDRTLTRRIRSGDWVPAGLGVLVCPGTPELAGDPVADSGATGSSWHPDRAVDRSADFAPDLGWAATRLGAVVDPRSPSSQGTIPDSSRCSIVAGRTVVGGFDC